MVVEEEKREGTVAETRRCVDKEGKGRAAATCDQHGLLGSRGRLTDRTEAPTASTNSYPRSAAVAHVLATPARHSMR